MQDSYTRPELAWLLTPAAPDPAMDTIRRTLGLIPSDGADALASMQSLASRGLVVAGRPAAGAALLARVVETCVAIRGLATFEETDEDETSHRTTILSGPLGHVSLWETPVGSSMVSSCGVSDDDPGLNLGAALRGLAEQSILEGTFYRIGTLHGSGARLTEDTSIQFADMGQLGWTWRPDIGEDELAFHETTLDSLVATVSGAGGQVYPADLTARMELSR